VTTSSFYFIQYLFEKPTRRNHFCFNLLSLFQNLISTAIPELKQQINTLFFYHQQTTTTSSTNNNNIINKQQQHHQQTTTTSSTNNNNIINKQLYCY